MEKLTVDLVYGQALFDAADDRGKVGEILDEYKAVSEVFLEYPLLKKLFSVPNIDEEDKKSAAEKVFGGRISKELLTFIFILIDKRRVGSWEGIGREYERLVWKRDGYAKGIIYSTLPIGEKRLKAFESKTNEAIGKKVKLENRIDESLIGGVKIYIDGKLIDASVKSRLDSMKQRIIQ